MLLIVSDDQAWSTFSRELMPSVYGQLVDQGALFRRAYVNTSLCCPSRAQILTGLYEHDTGVDANQVPLERPTFPMALHDSGYRTMLAGKYLNSWPCNPRPEFDRWACIGGTETANESLLDPKINVDGTWARFPGYQPDVLASLATEFIAATPVDQPFFVMYAPKSPHLPADDPRYAELPVTPPRGATFNENTMTPGTPQYARRQGLTPSEIKTSDADYIRMAHATRSLDDAVGTLLGSLGSRAQNTIVIYMSDNGYLYGEHRRFGKNDPWEESVNVPLVIRYPAVLPIDQPVVSHALAQNVDLAPTILQLAGIPWGADGRSLLPILSGERSGVRTAALLEHCRGATRWVSTCSGLTFNGGKSDTPGFEGIVTARHKYLEYDDGSKQLIDLKLDPLEQRNLAVGPHRRSSLEQSLAARLHAMMRPKPETTIATGPGPDLDDRIAAFRYFSPSRFATYRCRLVQDGADAAWKACPGQFWAAGNLADGTYVFQVEGIDEYGHVDPTPASRAFTVSAGRASDVSLTSHPSVDQAGTSASFTYASSLANADFECRLAAWDTKIPWSLCDRAGMTFGGLKDGTYRFEVRTKVSGSAMSDAGTGWVFRIDNAGPAVAFATEPFSTTQRQDATFRFVALEAMTGQFHCTLDGRSVECGKGVVSVDGLSAGGHSLRVSAMDLTGKVGVSIYHWTVDRSRPEVKFLWGPSRKTNSPTAVFRLRSSVSPDLFACQLDNLPLMPCFDAPIFRGLKHGNHTLLVWSYDAAGNRSAPARYAWKVA